MTSIRFYHGILGTTFVSTSWTPGASMMQEMTRVTSSSPYMILEPVEFLQLGQSAQPAVQAVLVKQQASEVRLSIPPILQIELS